MRSRTWATIWKQSGWFVAVVAGVLLALWACFYIFELTLLYILGFPIWPSVLLTGVAAFFIGISLGRYMAQRHD